jgi:hypothetical protein
MMGWASLGPQSLKKMVTPSFVVTVSDIASSSGFGSFDNEKEGSVGEIRCETGPQLEGVRRFDKHDEAN